MPCEPTRPSQIRHDPTQPINIFHLEVEMTIGRVGSKVRIVMSLWVEPTRKILEAHDMTIYILSHVLGP